MPIRFFKRDTVQDVPYTPQFSEPIFMGAGELSREDCMRAHALLDNIFGMISGLQQPLMATEVHDLDDVAKEREAQGAELAIMIEDLNRAVAYKA